MMAKEALRGVAFFGGGSGGHLVPGIALAEETHQRFPRCRTVFFRTRRRIEESFFEGLPYETFPLDVDSPGSRPVGWLRFTAAALRACRAIRRELRAAEFDVGFGLGGYASLPGIMAARQQGIPVILLEQNDVAGRTNRWLARFAAAVACAYPDTEVPAKCRAEFTGNPVRRQVLEVAERRSSVRGALRERTRAAAGGAERAGGRGECGEELARMATQGARRVLVVGGSQGARAVNELVVGSLPLLSSYRDEIRWVHVTGEDDGEWVESHYRAGGWRAEVLPFTSNLARYMSLSDLTISRSGGTTLSELAVMGLPAVLIPYPHHRDQHQVRNARRFVAGGAGRLMLEDETTPAALAGALEELLFDPGRLESMAVNTRALACPDAAGRVLDLALRLKRECRPRSESWF